MILQDAVEGYAFSLLALGARVKHTKEGIHEFEQRIQDAFAEELGDLVVCISANHLSQIKIVLV